MVEGIICNECNKKCTINVEMDKNDLKLANNVYTKKEYCTKLQVDNKYDIFTTVVRIKGANCNVVPVKSSKPLDKSLWVECSKVLSRIHVGAPIKTGDIVCKNVLNTKVDIICTKSIDKTK
ncbi:DUF1667 domain-containing protein [Clostridium sp. WILCCON 0269]|uniref:DUF1667 domain-containing protein n=1 Tax=Candidatus Clostridium eludens TaxID=3381663 RepID=A0ABW8SQK5_9CLOT